MILKSAAYGLMRDNGSSIRNPQHLKTGFPVSILQVDEPRCLSPAGSAPGRPEIEQDHLSLKSRQGDGVVAEVVQRERQVRRSGRPASTRREVLPQRRVFPLDAGPPTENSITHQHTDTDAVQCQVHEVQRFESGFQVPSRSWAAVPRSVVGNWHT